MSMIGPRANGIASLVALLALSGCGGSDEAAPPPTPPAPATYTVGGSVSGLAGTGLVLTLNGGSDLAIGSAGTFTFPASLTTGGAYAVAVKTQPATPTQTCTATKNSGSVATAAITDVAVSCTTNSYAVSGAVSGLAGSGLIVALNGGPDLAIGINGNFAFPNTVASGAPYTATVKTQPTAPSQTCVVTNGSGTVVSTAISNVSLACTTNTFAVAGTVGGLTGTGLVLRLNGATTLPVAANGSFAFPAQASGTSYAVTIATQPVSPFQTCVVTNGAGVIGTAAPAGIAVSCTIDAYSVSGTVNGLTGTGLVLRLNDFSDVTVNANGSFIFPSSLPRGIPYSVKVKTQTGTYRELCATSFGSGTNISANVSNVRIDCAVVLGFVYLVDDNDDLLEYGVQPVTGALLPIGVVGTLSGVTADFAVTPDRHTLFATDVVSSRVHAFSVDPSKGTLAVVGTPVVTGTASSNAASMAVSPSGKFLYVSNNADGAVALLNIDPVTGAPTLSGVAATPPVTGTPGRQILGVTPDGAFLYVLALPTTGQSSLTVYAINATTGALTAGSTIAAVDGEKFVVDPQGRFLFLVHDMTLPPGHFGTASISAYTINPANGALTAAGSEVTVSSNGARVVVDPSGSYVYLLSTINVDPSLNHIDTFNINQATGVLTVSGSPVLVPGTPYSGIAIDATGSFLFTRNFRAAGTFDPSVPLPDGSTFRIDKTGPTAGRPSSAGAGAGTPRGESVIVAIQ